MLDDITPPTKEEPQSLTDAQLNRIIEGDHARRIERQEARGYFGQGFSEYEDEDPMNFIMYRPFKSVL